MLSAETEARLRSLLKKYEGFDGDVQTATLKTELTDIIDMIVGADMAAEVKALATQLTDKVISDLEKSQDVDAAIRQIKTEIAAIEDAVRGEISDEEFETAVEKYSVKGKLAAPAPEAASATKPGT